MCVVSTLPRSRWEAMRLPRGGRLRSITVVALRRDEGGTRFRVSRLVGWNGVQPFGCLILCRNRTSGGVGLPGCSSYEAQSSSCGGPLRRGGEGDMGLLLPSADIRLHSWG